MKKMMHHYWGSSINHVDDMDVGGGGRGVVKSSYYKISLIFVLQTAKGGESKKVPMVYE